MHYQCSECRRPMGAMLDRKGRPELFKCPYSGRVAHTIPEHPPQRKTIKPNKSLATEDLSRRASRNKP